MKAWKHGKRKKRRSARCKCCKKPERTFHIFLHFATAIIWHKYDNKSTNYVSWDESVLLVFVTAFVKIDVGFHDSEELDRELERWKHSSNLDFNAASNKTLFTERNLQSPSRETTGTRITGRSWLQLHIFFCHILLLVLLQISVNACTSVPSNWFMNMLWALRFA